MQRHGGTRKADSETETDILVDDLKCIPGNQLGCYFCNDVTAPGNVSFSVSFSILLFKLKKQIDKLKTTTNVKYLRQERTM